MITKLIKEVSQIVLNEYERAAEQHGPTNNSAHESYAVIKEELEEAHDECIQAEISLDHYWKSVKANNEEEQMDKLGKIYMQSILSACEFIQTAAMAKKAIITMSEKHEGKTQEEIAI